MDKKETRTEIIDLKNEITKIVMPVLSQFEIGEIFLEDFQEIRIGTKDGKITNFSTSLVSGFSIRAMKDKETYFFSSDIISIEEIKRITKKLFEAANLKSLKNDFKISDKSKENGKIFTNNFKFEKTNDLFKQAKFFTNKLQFSSDFLNVKVIQEQSLQKVLIIRNDGIIIYDVRPISTMAFVVILKCKDGSESVLFSSKGFRSNMKDVWKFEEEMINEIREQYKNEYIAIDAPSGEMPVVFSNGTTGAFFHECVGHPLEADFVYGNTSCFSEKLGKKIATEIVSIVDDGSMKDKRGSLHFDDEGTETKENFLIENGVFIKPMSDRKFAKKLGINPSGNSRRQHFSDLPYPRMTNTYLAAGKSTQEEIIKSVKDGIFILSIGDGQVNISGGNFAFEALRSMRIRDGKVCEPIKNCTLSGVSPEVLQNITMVGNDLEVEDRTSRCWKQGQVITISCGQPSILVSAKIVVGGKSKS